MRSKKDPGGRGPLCWVSVGRRVVRLLLGRKPALPRWRRLERGRLRGRHDVSLRSGPLASSFCRGPSNYLAPDRRLFALSRPPLRPPSGFGSTFRGSSSLLGHASSLLTVSSSHTSVHGSSAESCQGPATCATFFRGLSRVPAGLAGGDRVFQERIAPVPGKAASLPDDRPDYEGRQDHPYGIHLRAQPTSRPGMV